MPNLLELPTWDEQGRLRIVVETPKNSPFKIHYDASTQSFGFQRSLGGLCYPHDWGFVPGTLAEDGDPLDALVLHDDVTWPGVVFPSTAIAILRIRDQKAGTTQEVRNDRLIAVPSVKALVPEFSAEKRQALEEFFRIAGEQNQKKVRILGWGDADEARAAVEQAQK